MDACTRARTHTHIKYTQERELCGLNFTLVENLGQKCKRMISQNEPNDTMRTEIGRLENNMEGVCGRPRVLHLHNHDDLQSCSSSNAIGKLGLWSVARGAESKK